MTVGYKVVVYNFDKEDVSEWLRANKVTLYSTNTFYMRIPTTGLCPWCCEYVFMLETDAVAFKLVFG